MYLGAGEVARAIECYEQALALAREIGDRRGAGKALSNLAVIVYQQDDTLRAIELYHQRLALAREVGDQQGEASVLSNLGVALRRVGAP